VVRVRGGACDDVIRSLLDRRLITVLGRRDTPGRPILFGTTFTFLERFGLTSTDDLPPLSSDAAQLTALASAADAD
jgi:segregation and condensation protein B